MIRFFFSLPSPSPSSIVLLAKGCALFLSLSLSSLYCLTLLHRFFLKIAADQGSAAAQFGLGNCYLEGRGVGKDTEVGIGLWKMSAEQNYAQAKAALKEMIKKPAKPSKGNKGKKGKGGRGGGKRDAGSAKKKGGTTSKVGFGKKT